MDDPIIPEPPDSGGGPAAGLAPLDRSRELAPSPSRPLDATLLRQLEGERDDAVSPRRIVQLLRRRKWLILGTAAALLAIAAIQVLTTTPLYRSFATVEVDPERPNVLAADPSLESSFASNSREEYLATQARKLRTRALAERVIDKLDLTSRPAFGEPVRKGFFIDQSRALAAAVRGLLGLRDRSLDERVFVNRFLDNLGVQVLRNTRLIEVSFTSPDPELAASVVDALVGEFIEQSLESRFQATTHVTDFLGKQLLDLKTAVEESEQKLIDYARDNDIVNLNERETVNVGKLADVSDELTRVENQLVEQRSRYQAIAGATPESFPEMLTNPTISRLESELSSENKRLAGLLSRHGQEWPEVKETRRQIGELEEQLREEKRQAIQLARDQYRLAVDRHQRLQAALEGQRRIVDRLNDDSIEYSILEREVETNKQLYEGLLQRLKEAGVSAGLAWSNIHLADRAAVPRRPAFPRRSLALAVALVLGLVLGVGAAVVVETLDDTVATSEEVAEELKLPTLGMIPVLDEAGRRLGTGGNGNGDRDVPIIAYEKSENWQAPAWEAYRSLRTSLLLSHSGRPPRSILVTSALPGEGKSTTVANTAIVLAQTGARTLILDLDLRRPTMADLFGVSAKQGMTEFLSGNSDLSSLACESGFANLYLIPAGPPAPNPAELLGSERLRTCLDWLLEYFDYLVIDSPPCLEITDSLVLCPQVDGLLLVVRAEKTPKDVVRKASERVAMVGGRILGVLINAVDARRSEYGYGSYHAYYARSGGD